MSHVLVSQFTFFGLFFSSLPARTGGRILTIYTLYDVFPPKEVAFGGGDDIAAHFGGEMPPKPQFWGRE